MTLSEVGRWAGVVPVASGGGYLDASGSHDPSVLLVDAIMDGPPEGLVRTRYSSVGWSTIESQCTARPRVAMRTARGRRARAVANRVLARSHRRGLPLARIPPGSGPMQACGDTWDSLPACAGHEPNRVRGVQRLALSGESPGWNAAPAACYPTCLAQNTAAVAVGSMKETPRTSRVSMRDDVASASALSGVMISPRCANRTSDRVGTSSL